MARPKRDTDTVTMTKGDVEVDVVRSAFEKVWSKKGWSLAEPKKAEAPRSAPEAPKKPEQTKD